MYLSHVQCKRHKLNAQINVNTPREWLNLTMLHHVLLLGDQFQHIWCNQIDYSKWHTMCKLHKSIYGLKQTSCSWNNCFDYAIKIIDFDQNEDEPCVYKKTQGSMVVFLVLNIDDIMHLEWCGVIIISQDLAIYSIPDERFRWGTIYLGLRSFRIARIGCLRPPTLTRFWSNMWCRIPRKVY